jgi:hypothetical protein
MKRRGVNTLGSALFEYSIEITCCARREAFFGFSGPFMLTAK